MIPLRLYAAGGALAASFVAGGWAWQHTPLIGPAAVQKRLKDQAAKDRDTIAQQKGALDAYDKALTTYGNAMISNGQTATSEASQMSSFWRGQCKTAFEAGFANGKGSSAGGAVPLPDGLSDDLREVWSRGAFAAPSAGLPAKSERAPGQ